MSTTPTTPTTPEPIIAATPNPPAATPDINTSAADLRIAAVAAEQPPVAPAPEPAAAAPPTPTPEPYTVTRNDGGTVTIKLETGETFTGDPVEVATKLAVAKV